MTKLDTKQEKDLSTSDFAFPKERKEPIENAAHVRDAIARFDQVKDVTNQERDEAWERIKKAAGKFGIEMNEQRWQQLFKKNNHPVPSE